MKNNGHFKLYRSRRIGYDSSPFIIGEIIKGTELLGNKWIPLTVLVVSIGFTPLLLGAYTADNVVQAVLVAGVTVFGNELIKQSSKGDVK